MDINMDNYCEYGKYNHLIKLQKEPLFLKPDSTRTRYPIGWNGCSRYLSGTLKVTYNGLPCNIFEEKNGVFFNFDVAPDSNTNYDDYEVSYMTRPLDYAFATGTVEGGYPKEEYFLFPNWNNALGEGDAFWIGKWQASNNGSNIAQSKSGVNLWNDISRDDAILACKNKGSKFSMVTNREWVSIARWCDHHEIHVKGNTYGSNTNNLDGDGATLVNVGGGYNARSGYHFVTGDAIPDTWNHNLLPNGIHNMVGNVWEWVDGLENRNGEIYIYDENNQYVDSEISVLSSGTGNTYIKDITNTTEAILNEGIANTVSTNGYIPSNLDKACGLYIGNGQIGALSRGGSSFNGINAGLWAFKTDDGSGGVWWTGFRLARKI